MQVSSLVFGVPYAEGMSVVVKQVSQLMSVYALSGHC